MNNNRLSRIVSIGIMGFIAGFFIHSMRAREALMGREAYLAKQAASYDQHAAHPDMLVISIIAGLIMACIYFGIYELLALVVRKILDKINAADIWWPSRFSVDAASDTLSMLSRTTGL
jgi:hypothetical protein